MTEVYMQCPECCEVKPCRVVAYDSVYMSRPELSCEECFGPEKWTPHGEVSWDDLAKPHTMGRYMLRSHYAAMSVRFLDPPTIHENRNNQQMEAAHG